MASSPTLRHRLMVAVAAAVFAIAAASGCGSREPAGPSDAAGTAPAPAQTGGSATPGAGDPGRSTEDGSRGNYGY